jgi:hypothetical protein
LGIQYEQNIVNASTIHSHRGSTASLLLSAFVAVSIAAQSGFASGGSVASAVTGAGGDGGQSRQLANGYWFPVQPYWSNDWRTTYSYGCFYS